MKEPVKTDIYLDLVLIETGKSFRKYFDTEFDRDKFKRKLKFSKRLRVLGVQSEGEI